MLKQKTIFAILAGVIVIALSTYWIYSSNNKKPAVHQTDQERIKAEESTAKKKGYDIKQDTESSRQRSSTIQPDTKNTTPDGRVAGQAVMNPVITTLESLDNGSVVIDALVGGATSGTCTVTFRNNNSTVIRESPIVRVTNYYACQEIGIERSAFNAPGNWNVVLQLHSDAGDGSASSKVTVSQGAY